MILAAVLAVGMWCWDPVVPDTEHGSAQGYRLYYSESPSVWSACHYLEISLVDAGCGTPEAAECCDNGWADSPPDWPIAYFVVTAYNAAGESSTEHGPIEPCLPPPLITRADISTQGDTDNGQ